MKYYTYIFAIVCVLLQPGCGKPEGYDDLSGEQTLSGTVFLKDTLNTGVYKEVLLHNLTIRIKHLADSSTENFLMSLKSDDFGNFTSETLSPASYIVHAEKDTLNLHFRIDTIIDLHKDLKDIRFFLTPDTVHYNILSVICRDNATKGLLSGVNVCFFTSRQAADSNICLGNFTSQVTNNYGRVLLMQIPPEYIYFNARDSIGTLDIRSKDSANVKINGLRQRILYLK
jgi:hypothetical protein